MERQEREIGFDLLWKVLKNSLIWLLVAAVGLGVLVGIYTSISTSTTYTARTKYLITSRSDSPATIQADVVDIINTKTTAREILTDAGIPFDENLLGRIKNMVIASASGNNALVVVSVTGADVDTIVQIAQAYEKYLPGYFNEIVYAGRNTTLRVYDYSDTKLYPNSTDLIRNSAIGALAGFVLAYVVFFIIELINGKVRGAATLREYISDVAVLGKIPTPDGKKVTAKTAELPATAWLSTFSPAIEEAYRGLRTSVAHLQMTEVASKVVGITATASKDGSAVVAINLAQSYAQLGKRVLLVEADMRAPVVKGLLGLTLEIGLAEVLGGLVAIESAVENVNGVDVLASVSAVASPAEILAGEGFANLLKTASENYDLVLVLFPAVGEVSDACVAAPHVSGYVTVVRSEKTELNALQLVVGEMARLNMKNLGFVITDDISKN